VLVALLALLLQGVLVPTHIHAPFAASAQLSSDAAAGPVLVQAAHERDQVSCIICQGLASARSAVLPAVSAIVARSRTGETAASATILSAPPRRAHFWQSRAPPSFL
jgi:hypothetical protein